jgi:DNA-binding NtrC family response regulator
MRLLKFTLGFSSKESPEKLNFDFKADSEINELKTGQLPAVYLFQMENQNSLVSKDKYFVDRGKKHRARSLSSLLLGYNRIPVIIGGYTGTNQLRRSIYTLLRNAKDLGERNTYFIGVEDEVFNQLWEKTPVRTSTSKNILDPIPINFDSKHFPMESNQAAAQRLMELLPKEEIPAELHNKYIGQSWSSQMVRHLILIAAKHDNPVLILGGTGSGKEVTARSIHTYSDRKHERFTAVNCGGIPTELFEAELFGYEKGAFTGAVSNKEGLWTTAHRGTLFLDEIGDLPLNHQVKILRALEDREIRPVGSTKGFKIDARIISSTNKDLAAMVKKGEFREDLYYRLMTFQIHTPSLRNHPEDIPEIAQAFWRGITKESNSQLPIDILEELKIYKWPGNGRELKMVLIKLFTLFGDKKLNIEHLKMVFLLQGHTLPVRVEETSYEGKILQRQADCYQHLNRIIEVIRALKVTLRPIILSYTISSKTRESLLSVSKTHVAELEILCLHPLLFYSIDTFKKVSHLNGLFRHFLTLLKTSAKRARQFWEKKISKEYNHTQILIFQEVEKILK